MRTPGRHIGSSVSALVDGHLDPAGAEEAWAHVLRCGACRQIVEQEVKIKSELARLAGNEPSASLLGRLYSLQRADNRSDSSSAWAAVEEIEQRHGARRRVGLAVLGAGSVSAAVIGFASLSGTTLGIGQPGNAPSASLTRPSSGATTAVIAPAAVVHGWLPARQHPDQGRPHTNAGSRP